MTLPDRLSGLTGRLLRTRWLVRAPVWLFRMGLGFLFGKRMLLLEHHGRRTGRRRYAVLEVVDRPAPDTYVIVSGFGARSQWYRNVLADPQVRISVGLRRNAAAVAILLSPVQADETLARYADRHPQAWARLRTTLEAALHTTDLQLPMFAVTIRSQEA